MAVSNEEINAYLAANPGMSDADIASAMNQYGVSAAQMAQATGLGQDVVQSRYDAAVAPLSMQSVANTPDMGAAGIDANDQLYKTPLSSVAIPPQGLTGEVDPYVYAYEYGVANNDFSGLRGLLQQTPDSTQLVSKYNLTPEQINQIEFGTGFDLDQSGGYGAGKVGNDWDYNKYLDELREGNTDNALNLYRSTDPQGAQRLQNMYQELQQQQKVTADSWATGNLGSKDAAAMDFALRLMENGVGSIYDLGQRTVEKVVDGYNGPEVQQDIEYFNKKTGEALPDWARVASGNNSGSKLNYRINFAEDGTPIPYTTPKQSDWMEFREGVLKPAVSLASLAFPAIAPYVAAGNAINAADKGEWGTAIVSALTAVPGFNSVLKFSPETLSTLNTAKTTAQVLNAIDKENPIALANTLMQTDAGKELMLQDMGGGITMGDVLNTAKIAQLSNTGQYAEALAVAGELTNSPNLKIAASGENFRQAVNTGDPFKIFSAAGQLERAVKSTGTATQTGGITNRMPDDMTEAGAAAFADARRAGADDSDALAASNAVTGVQINKIPDAETGNAVTTTYTRTPAAEAGLQRERLNEEYASSLGKTVGTLSKEESENFSDKIENAIGQGGYAVLKGASIQDILSGNYSALPTDEKGFTYDEQGVPRVEVVGYNKLDSAGNVINMETTENGSKVAGNVADAIVENITGLEGTTGKIVQQGLSTLLGGIGEQVADISTSFGNMGLISRDNAGVTAGKYLEDIGKRLQLPETKQALDNWVTAVDKEPTYFGKISAGVKGAFQNPLVLTEVAKEIGQEILPGAIGLKVAKYAGVAAGVASSTFLNAVESAGSTGRQSYDEEIAKGTPPAEAAKIADRKAGYAGIITMATSGIMDAGIAKKYGSAIEDFLGRKASSAGGEFAQEGLEEGLIALATGKTPAEALTQSVVGSFVGAKTAGTIQTAADVQADLASSFASQGLKSTDGSFKAETIVPIDSDPSATAEEVAGSPEAITAADAQNTVSELGLNVPDDVAVSLATKIQEANNSGNDVSVTSDANVVTINDATANTQTTVDANTGTTTVVDANTNITSQTKVDTNTNTQTTVVVDANTNTNTQTTVNTNTNTTTSTTVDTNNNTTIQTTINANTNTQTTVVTDTNTNTQTTINVNTDTGEVIDEKETPIPDGWKPPVIELPVVPPAAITPTPVAPAAPAAPAAPTVPNLAPRLPDETRTGAGGFGLPVGMTLNPASLRSRETQKAIDPLARVKEAQAEFERDAMIQNVDPRLMQVLQQRSDPQQQSQQFDKDIGALAKLLSGKPDTPSSDAGNYYSYGSEDSIDDILGGKAANYKEGGFVEPLKASGGSMALPLLAKSGGALGSYSGRENFKEGKHVAGKGDGQSDDIPAWLADGEFVFPADVVSALGNGSTKAGTDKLYEMMHSIRDRARSKGPKDLPPPALKSPLDYLKSSKRSTA